MPSATRPRVLVETVSGVTVASFADHELTEQYVIEEVSEQLYSLADHLGLSQVVLNFREVKFMSSMMMAVLLKFKRKVVGAGGLVKLCCIAPNLMEIFKIMGFDKLFEIYPQESGALDSF
jgi:anti-sigma B factor antagonist